MQFMKAVRKASPMLISVSGVSGSGKTYGSLLLAAGIAGPSGRVGFIDTENGRGSMYADEPGIMAALPNGYEIAQLDAPYSPDRYIEAIEAAEKAGMNVLVIDSATHEWEGIGGCAEIAETKKMRGMPNWSLAKMLHKRFMNHCLSTNMHLIFCLRAREKTRIVKNAATGKEEFVNDGVQPICEKNFVFEQTVSLMVDEKTHFATPVKVPKPLVNLFPGAKMLTKEDGERIRQWNETGSALNPFEQLLKRGRAAAEEGRIKYKEFLTSLTTEQKRLFPKDVHAENIRIAEEHDHIPVFGSAEHPVEFPTDFDGAECIWNGKRMRLDEESGSYRPVEHHQSAA